MILLLDNFDSFTYNLVDYFQQLGVSCQVVRNDVPLEEIGKRSFQGICLSPGPETPARAGVMPALIEKYSSTVPILGICLGHQALGAFFGASLERALRPMHGKISSIQTNQKGLFQGLPGQMNVVRYHSLILRHLPQNLEITAQTDEGEIMAMQHRRLPIHGVQFHPEAVLTEHGLQLLKNWMSSFGLTP